MSNIYHSYSGSFDNVADDELLDGLVLGRAAGAVRASHWLHVSAPLLGSTVVTTLLGHLQMYVFYKS